jgi:nucleoside-diphosphate-sugar epimerase
LRFLKLFKGIERGLFWMIGSGDNFYHLVYVDDLVRGYLLAGDRTDLSGETFIIAGEAPVRVKDLVVMIGQAVGKPVKQRHVPVAPIMLAARAIQGACKPLRIEPPLYPRRLDFFIANRSFSIDKARRQLGYEPQVNLTTGLACTAEWYRKEGLL